MKKVLIAAVMLFSIAGLMAQGKFKPYTIYEIQKPPDDSLHMADSLGWGSSRWLTQCSPVLAKGDTFVTITGLVQVPPRMITYTAGGRTMILTDTGAGAGKAWHSIMVRYMKRSGTSGVVDQITENNFDANGYNSVKLGQIITVRGKISEFGGNMGSYTQIEPDTNYMVDILSSNNPIPPPIPVTMADFKNPDGTIKVSTGESYEASRVVLTKLVAGTLVNSAYPLTDATFYFFDSTNAKMSTYDWCYNYSKRNGDEGTLPAAVIPLPPVEGRVIDTLIGFISTSAGSNSYSGYRMCPVFPGDIVLGGNFPQVETHRRYPVVVAVDSAPRIVAKNYAQVGGGAITLRKLVYRVGSAAWQEIEMSSPLASDSTSTATIPAQVAGSVVTYFIKITDANSNVSFLANANAETQRDTTKGFFTYKVLNRTVQPVLTIQDIQATPYLHGYSQYFGATDSIGGIITADTSSLVSTPLSAGGPRPYFIQSTNQPFSGLWFTDTAAATAKVKLGDSVIVTGTVSERGDITNLYNIQSVRIVSRGNSLPAPVKLKTELFGLTATNGNKAAEPYEGMLVQFDNVTVKAIDSYVINTGNFDYYQYEVSNSNQNIFVMRDGRNSYSSDPGDASLPNVTMLRVGNKIQSLIGVLHYASKRFKVVPRTNADYVGLTSVQIEKLETAPREFALLQNYPNPFNPSTMIQYALPRASQVTLKVFNVIGQEVMTLVNEHQNAGTYSVRFDASSLSSGMYLYRVSAGGLTQVKKMLLVK